ncbi:hypothetical protein EVAR_90177_1 [Eumeta japonica]|uniref:Uncharacterized protein n=1 Tax=Eumeta variegata TaxID=151549 RepID=A0A4C1WYN5_EUMVA|nr:hypothetical protein EVAR_90177_1 [Eumeta japonica]
MAHFEHDLYSERNKIFAYCNAGEAFSRKYVIWAENRVRCAGRARARRLNYGRAGGGGRASFPRPRVLAFNSGPGVFSVSNAAADRILNFVKL